MHPNLLKLVAAEQIDDVTLDALEEADVAFPTVWTFALKNGNATNDRLFQWFAPG